MSEATTVIPAHPGWSLLQMDEQTGLLDSPDPVIAWLIMTRPDWPVPEVMARPVIAEGVFPERPYLIRPDGRVEHAGRIVWESLVNANSPTGCEERLRCAQEAGE
jgi:hypothetical protein